MVLIVLALILIPTPALLLDILIALNLLFALIILLAALRTKKLTDFPSCPALLLLSTVFGLAVTIDAARFILTKGAAFDGRLIQLFAALAAGSGGTVHTTAGFTVFIAISVIFTVVITRNCARAAEVAARFLLESMPGIQMYNDVEYSNGNIDKKEADARKEALKKESDFCDRIIGASKFISGNGKIILIIVAITIFGGIIIGARFHDESIYDAIKIYAPLAISSGFFFLLPVVFLSIAAKRVLYHISSVQYAAKNKNDEKTDEAKELPTDLLTLELGFGLIPLVDKDKGAELLERMQGMRRVIALEMGVVIPKIRIIDNMLLYPSEYCFKIRGVDTGKNTIRMGCCLCINSGFVKEELAGEETKDPAYGLPALWIPEDKRDEAERAGYTVVDPPSIIATHLEEIIKRHAAELFKDMEAVCTEQ